MFGRHTDTRSGCSRSSMSCRSVYPGTPNSAARSSVRSLVRPATAHSSASVRDENAFVCWRPHQSPVPTTATRMALSLMALPPSAQPGLDQDDEQEEDTADHLLVVRAEDADLVDQVLDHFEQQRTGEGSDQRAGTAR